MSLSVVPLRVTHLWIVNYCYVIISRESGHAVAVDPAWQIEIVEDALMRHNAKLKGVLLTHAHPDHTHLAEPLSESHGCPVWMSHDEIEASGYRSSRLVGLEEKRFKAGEIGISPILTPGHTVGSACYLLEDNLFTGDTLFAEGCGLCLSRPAAYDLFASFTRLKRILSDETCIFPGHSYGVPPGRDFSRVRKENIYLQFDDREQFTSYRLRKGQSRAKLFGFC